MNKRYMINWLEHTHIKRKYITKALICMEKKLILLPVYEHIEIQLRYKIHWDIVLILHWIMIIILVIIMVCYSALTVQVSFTRVRHGRKTTYFPREGKLIWSSIRTIRRDLFDNLQSKKVTKDLQVGIFSGSPFIAVDYYY